MILKSKGKPIAAVTSFSKDEREALIYFLDHPDLYPLTDAEFLLRRYEATVKLLEQQLIERKTL